MKKAILTLFTIIISLFCYGNCISGDCINGNGIYKLKSGSIYNGQFKDGKPHGKGLLKTSKGICKANWIKGKKEGKAIWKLNNDSKVYCAYKNGKKHGKGKLVNVDGEVVTLYVWNNGKLIKEEEEKIDKVVSDTNSTEQDSHTKAKPVRQIESVLEEPTEPVEMTDLERQTRTILSGESVFVCNRRNKCSAVVRDTSEGKVKIELTELCEPGGFFSTTMDIRLSGTTMWIDKKHIYKNDEGCVGKYTSW